MSKNTGSSDQSGKNKPVPTGNSGTRDGSGGGGTKPAPTGNFGTFSENPPIKKKS